MAHGLKIQSGWRELASQHGLSIHVDGIPPLAHISFGMPEPLVAQTLYAQEMLERGYLVGSSVYTTQSYTSEIVDQFLTESDAVFTTLKQGFEQGHLKSLLQGPPKHDGFKLLS